MHTTASWSLVLVEISSEDGAATPDEVDLERARWKVDGRFRQIHPDHVPGAVEQSSVATRSYLDAAVDSDLFLFPAQP